MQSIGCYGIIFPLRTVRGKNTCGTTTQVSHLLLFYGHWVLYLFDDSVTQKMASFILHDQVTSKEGVKDVLAEIDTEFRVLNRCIVVCECMRVVFSGKTYGLLRGLLFITTRNLKSSSTRKKRSLQVSVSSINIY